MKVVFKRFDTELPVPEYKSEKAAAFDLYARTTVVIAPGKVEFVPLNIALELPPHHWALVAARSSLFKKGVMMVNGIGVGDEDYCGDGDEYRAALYNFTKEEVTIQRGDRIVQMIILNRERVELLEVQKLNAQNRGGFGSTGEK